MANDFRFIMVRENYAASSTFSGGSYEELLPITNLQDYRMGIVARTTDATNSSTKIKIDLGSPKRIGAIVLCNGNWSLDATYRVFSSNSSDMSSVRYDTGSGKTIPGFVVNHMLLKYGDPDFWSGILRNRLLSRLRRNLIEVIPSSQIVNSYSRYWEIDIDDTANTAGFLQYSIAFIGPTFNASINYGSDNGLGVTQLMDQAESLSGSRTTYDRGRRRKWRGAFGFLQNEELFGEVMRSMIDNGQSEPTFIIPDQTDTLNLQLRSFPATFQTLSEIQQLLITDRGSTVLDFEEWL